MTKKIELTEQEQVIIQNALNQYWNDAVDQLDHGAKMHDATRRNLGYIEKGLLEKQRDLSLPLLRKLESL